METDDLVQETLLRTLRSVERFEPEHSGAFQAYLRHAVLNRVRDEVRRARRAPDLLSGSRELVDPAPSPVEDAIGRETLRRYEEALGLLTEDDREAVVARIELGFSYREVAEATGKPSPDAARMAVKRAVARLAEALADVH